MKTIGLLGGMSWESTIPYYRLINEGIKQRLGGLHSAQVLLHSVDFHEIEECQRRGEWDKTGDILASASFPAVDPNHLDECLADEDAPFVNRALSAYAPGSVFKLFVAAAALEEGVDYRAVNASTGSIEDDGM